MTANIALVIPVRDDTPALAHLLEQISAWSLQPAEIVVVAAGHDEELTTLCALAGCKLYAHEANRGAQLDFGARHATASTLWFLHADAVPPREGIARIASAIAEGVDAGCFRFRFQGPATPTKRALVSLIELRIRLGGTPYGDQGIFVRRTAYVASGGFPHQPLFEEVELLRRLRRHGRFRQLDAPMLVATRRWDRDGWWRRSLRNRWLALRYALGVPAEKLARDYHRTMHEDSPTTP